MSGLEELTMSELHGSTIKFKPNRLRDAVGAGAQRGNRLPIQSEWCQTSEDKGGAMTQGLGGSKTKISSVGCAASSVVQAGRKKLKKPKKEVCDDVMAHCRGRAKMCLWSQWCSMNMSSWEHAADTEPRQICVWLRSRDHRLLPFPWNLRAHLYK